MSTQRTRRAGRPGPFFVLALAVFALWAGFSPMHEGVSRGPTRLSPTHGFLLAPPRLRVEPIAFNDLDDNPYKKRFGTAQQNIEFSGSSLGEACRVELAHLGQAGLGASSLAADLIDFELAMMMWGARHITPEARMLAARCVAIRESNLDTTPAKLAGSLVRRGLTLAEAGNYDGARVDYARAVELYERDLPHKAMLTRCRLASVLIQQGEYPEARRVVGQVAVPETTDGARDLARIETALRVSKGVVLAALGDYEGAQELLTGALQALANAPARRAAVLSNLAVIAAATGDDRRAREMAEEAVALDAALFRAWHPFLTADEYNLALILARLGYHAEARRKLEALAVLQEDTLGPEHPDLVLTLLGLANLLTLDGEFDAAKQLFDRVVPLERRLSPRDPDLPFALASAAWFHWNSGGASKALELSLEAERLARQQFREAVRGLSEREALRYETIRISGLDIGMTYLASLQEAKPPADVARVWTEITHSRAIVLDEMARRARASAQSRFASDLERSRGELSRLVNAAIRTETPPHGESIAAARDEKERLERVVAIASASPRAPVPREDPDLSQIAKALPAESALVAFVSYASVDRAASEPSGDGTAALRYAAFVMSSDRPKPQIVPLGPRIRIDELVNDWRAEAIVDPRRSPDGAQRAEARYRERARALKGAVWDPLGRLVAGCRNVFVVPDGSLHRVTWATLPSGRDRYLIDEGITFHSLSAERDLLHRAEPTHRSAGLVAFAPDFDALPNQSELARAFGAASENAMRGARPAHDACVARETLKFERLRAAGDEARAIAALWVANFGEQGGTRILVGGEADELTIKQLGPGTRVVHLATHGYFHDERCASVLSNPAAPSRGRNVSGVITLPAGGGNPLLLSGLAMAGANRTPETFAASGEDGILTAEEIASMNLDGVDWVVLSGCDTGLGELFDEEGVLGLQRAFRIAGASSVIMSLFPVQDADARAWMIELYRARLAGRSTADAVREASRRRLADAREAGRSTHPFFWGAFVATGDWR